MEANDTIRIINPIIPPPQLSLEIGQDEFTPRRLIDVNSQTTHTRQECHLLEEMQQKEAKIEPSLGDQSNSYDKQSSPCNIAVISEQSEISKPTKVIPLRQQLTDINDMSRYRPYIQNQFKQVTGISGQNTAQFYQTPHMVDFNSMPHPFNTKMIINRDPSILKEFDNIVRTDFSRFIQHRKCLNRSNLYLVYIFYFLQSAGILVTTLSVSLFQKQFVFIGVVLNTIASLIHVYNELNSKISTKLQKDIISVLQCKYICESQLIDDPINIQQAQQVQQIQQKQSVTKEP